MTTLLNLIEFLVFMLTQWPVAAFIAIAAIFTALECGPDEPVNRYPLFKRIVRCPPLVPENVLPELPPTLLSRIADLPASLLELIKRKRP